MQKMKRKAHTVKTLFINTRENPRDSVEKINYYMHRKRLKHRNERKSLTKITKTTGQSISNTKISIKSNGLSRNSSMPDFTKEFQKVNSSNKTSAMKNNSINPYSSNYFVNVYKSGQVDCTNPFNNPLANVKWRVYRCQLSTQDDSCCCSCNSDAMFEVMKSLYDCYKKKNCDHCNCILCGHLPREERKLGELRKSGTALSTVGVGTKKQKSEMLKKIEKTKKAEKDMVGKTPAQKEKMLKELAMSNAPLPEGKTASEKELIAKVRADLGLPPEPKTSAEKEKLKKAEAAGLIVPLEGKSMAQKEKILKAQTVAGLPLPEGRTPSEKALISKVQAGASAAKVPSEKLRKAKADGLLTPLAGKTPEQREKILKGLVKSGIPLPEAKTESEQKIISKVRADMGLPPEPKTPSMKEKYAKAQAQGIITPLEGKSAAQKEKILKAQAEAGLPLPEGRTASEKAVISKVRAGASAAKVPSEKLRKAKAAGLLTPLTGKTPEQKEKILKGLVKAGLPLPEAKTESEQKIISKVRADMGLPPEPKTPSMKEKYAKAQAQGIITPLEGKSATQKEKILKAQAEAGLPLPEGRTSSEKALINKIRSGAPAPVSAAKIPSEKLRKAKEAGLLTPLSGKTPEQKEKILKGLAKAGIPLPEAKTESEKKLISKVRADMGLPPEPKTSSMKEKYAKAQAQGIITPLEGKSTAQKEKILKAQAEAGLSLPEGRTASEKALIQKVKSATGERKRSKSKTITATAPSLPPEKARKLDEKTAKVIKEGKGPSDECICGLLTPESDKVSNEKAAETAAGKVPSEKLQKAKAAGLLTPLAGKTPEQQEKILKGLVKAGIPLPEAKTKTEMSLIDKVRADLGLPPEPKSPSMKEKYAKAQAQGLITPLEGKSAAQKEKILKAQAEAGLPLPEGRTPSEKALVSKVRAGASAAKVPSEKLRKAKAAGLLTPLAGKTPEQKEKILKGLVKAGVPLPEAKTESEQKIISKVRADMGLPPEPKTPSIKEKYAKAQAQGIITPFEGKSAAQKEKILKAQAEAGLPLPEGRTVSEKALISKVRAGASAAKVPSEKLRKAKAAGLLTPLAGKTPEQREKILKGLIKAGIPLPEAKTKSEKQLISKVREDMGLPPEPITPSIKEKYAKAQAQGLITPLEGKNATEKEKILKAQAEAGLPLPEGRTSSEKALINKIRSGAPARVSAAKNPSEKLRKAKEAGLLTPLSGKTPEQKEKILKGLAKAGIPLPESKTESEKKLISKVRADMGLPPEPKTSSIKEKYAKAQAQGIITPLEGKSTAQKEKILKAQAEAGLSLPEGRTASEKALIQKVKSATGERKRSKSKAVTAAAPSIPPEKARKLDEKTAKVMKEGKGPSDECICGLLTPEFDKVSIGKAAEKAAGKVPSEKLRKAKAAGLLTPLAGKTPEQKEKILKGLVKAGIPLPEAKTKTEMSLIDKVRADLGLPPEPKSPSMKEKYDKAQAQGIITPLEGKSAAQKEKILKAQAEAGLPLPEGRTPSEKALISKVQAGASAAKVPSEKLRKAKADGLLTPLAGKTPEQREKILKGLVKSGIPLPEAKTESEQKIISKVRADMGLPPEPKTPSMKEKYAKAQAQGIITPLEGKSAAQKEKILKAQAEAGLPLPEGRTASEKAVISKVRAGASAAKVPSEKLRKAKAAGLLTPLTGKTPEQKEKILKGLVKAGLPLPEAKTESEQKIISKVRADMGLPPEPKTPSMKEKYAKAQAQGIITPLEGKSATQKEKILKAQAEAGLPLPEGRTSSEKALINKIRSGAPAPVSAAKIPSEKLRKAKEAGLLTPLSGKTPEQKEKILKGLAKAGIPLPEAKTESEKKLISKVRADMGLPPEPKTSSMKEKYAKAQAQGIITPLEGKSTAQKEKILKAQAEAGLSLPEGRTASEKALIQKVKSATGERKRSKSKTITATAPSLPPEKARKLDEKTAKVMKEGKGPSDECICGLLTPESDKVSVGKAAETTAGKVPSEKLRKAKAAGLLTPLAGKTPEQKEKILKGLAKSGIPLPEGKTESEKKIIDKVRTTLGLPPEPKSPSMKEKYAKAQAQGLITPLEGKSAAQKEKILKAQTEAGLLLPEGRTPSEKTKIQQIKTKSKKVGAAALKGKISKGIGGAGISKAGIVEEFEDVLKTTTCDRGCGCDKKKIRFKHSYVKIRVTSPDISSLCPCPNECVPGVKGGVLVDNEGIKVTVGSAVGFPKFSIPNEDLLDEKKSLETNSITLKEEDAISEIYFKKEKAFKIAYKNMNMTENYSNESLSMFETQNNYKEIHNYHVNEMDNISDRHNTSTSTYLIACSESVSLTKSRILSKNISSSNSILLVRTESSLSLSTKSSVSIRTISIISFHNFSQIISSSSRYLCYECSRSYTNIQAEDSEHFTNIINYSALDSLASDSQEVEEVVNDYKPPKKTVVNNDTNIYRVSNTNNNGKERSRKIKDSRHKKKHDPIIVINDLNSEQDILKIVSEVLAKKDIANSSSIFVVVPISDEYDTDLTESVSSTICIRVSKNFFDWNVNNTSRQKRQLPKKAPASQGLKIISRGKQFFLDCTLSHSKNLNKHSAPTTFELSTQNKDCQVSSKSQNRDKRDDRFRGVSMDTTQDRPCCCPLPPKEPISSNNYGSKEQFVANAFSEIMTPMILKQGQGLNRNAYLDITRLDNADIKTNFTLNQTTSISICEVPPCASSFPSCHSIDKIYIIPQHTMGTQSQYPGLDSLQQITPRNPPCKCSPGMPGAIIQRVQKNFQSVGCGPNTCKDTSAHVPLIRNNQGINEHNPCSTCGRPTMKDGRKICCLCSGKEKEVHLPNLCPCETHKPDTVSTGIGSDARESKAEGEKIKKIKSSKKKPCTCTENFKGVKKTKNVLCECPEEVKEPLPWELNEYTFLQDNSDDKARRKMKSDLTQTTSGFRINFKKKPNLQAEMSFEDALKYFEEHPEEGGSEMDEFCACDEDGFPLGARGKPPGDTARFDNPDVDCECPPESDAPKEPEEQLPGLKLHIGGKGSTSKGLSGICCFDMLQESNGFLTLHD